MKFGNYVVRLYRAMDENDSPILISKETSKVANHEMLQEIVSHELYAKTQRGLLYSFTTRLDKATDYAKRCGKKKICFIDISLEKPTEAVIDIIPVFDRDFWLNRIALDNVLLDEGMLVNPATRRGHTIVGLANFCQRSASGWASSLSEVMLQVNGLELKDISDMKDQISPEQTEQLLYGFYIKEVPGTNIDKLRTLVQETFDRVNLKRKYLLDIVNGDSWYKSRLNTGRMSIWNEG